MMPLMKLKHLTLDQLKRFYASKIKVTIPEDVPEFMKASLMNTIITAQVNTFKSKKSILTEILKDCAYADLNELFDLIPDLTKYKPGEKIYYIRDKIKWDGVVIKTGTRFITVQAMNGASHHILPQSVV
jgi:hypothetical protein